MPQAKPQILPCLPWSRTSSSAVPYMYLTSYGAEVVRGEVSTSSNPGLLSHTHLPETRHPCSYPRVPRAMTFEIVVAVKIIKKSLFSPAIRYSICPEQRSKSPVSESYRTIHR